MKLKFYSFKRLAALLLLLGIGSVSSAQELTTLMVDYYTGNPYTQSGSPILVTYTIRNDQQSTMTGLRMADFIPVGTTYYEESTVVNGVAVPDNNGRAPFVVDDITNDEGLTLTTQWGAGVLPVGQTITLTYVAIADANAGVIKQYGGRLRGTYAPILSFDAGFPRATIYIAGDGSCSAAYIVHGATATSGSPNNYVSSIHINDGAKATQLFVGTSTNNYYANTNTKLPLNNLLLTDASAIAFDNATQRLYFVNNSTTTQQELYYINTAIFPARAYKFSNTTNYPIPTGTGVGKNITRMTWSPYGYGYALTDDGSHLFKITVTNNVPLYTDMGPVEDYDLDAPVANETGGDIATDWFGSIYLVTNSGKFYIIQVDEGYPLATYKGVIPGLPTSGNQSLTFNHEGRLIVSGAYQDAYAIFWDSYGNPTSASSVSGGSTGIWHSADYASCYFPPNTFRKGVSTKSADKPNTPEVIANASVRVSPNPFINTINLKVALPTAETVKIRLMDMFGRTVYTSTQRLTSDVNTVNLNIPGSLTHGIYVLDVFAGSKRLATKKLSHL